MAPAHCLPTIFSFFFFVSLCPSWQLSGDWQAWMFRLHGDQFHQCRQCRLHWLKEAARWVSEWTFFFSTLQNIFLLAASDWACRATDVTKLAEESGKRRKLHYLPTDLPLNHRCQNGPIITAIVPPLAVRAASFAFSFSFRQECARCCCAITNASTCSGNWSTFHRGVK